MSSSCSLNLVRLRETQEHGIATIKCIKRGLDVFSPDFNQHERDIQVVRGIHGFQVYAAEYWTEYLLSSEPQSNEANGMPTLYKQATNLAVTFENLPGNPATQNSDFTPCYDERLSSLDHLPILQLYVKRSLLARSISKLEAALVSNSGQ